MKIDGNFPTVKSPNPENPEGFYLAVDLAKQNDVDFILGTDPDSGIEGLEGVQDGHALGVVVGGHLGEEQGGGDGVLVPDEVAQHVAVALLGTMELTGSNVLRFELADGTSIIVRPSRRPRCPPRRPPGRSSSRR